MIYIQETICTFSTLKFLIKFIVQGHTNQRQEWIKFLDQQLSDTEDERMDLVWYKTLLYAKQNTVKLCYL
jgi:hypothetical protein